MFRHSLIPELGASLAKPALMEEFAARYVMERTPFPLEVCQRIAPYLVRPCSVAATLSVRRGKPRKMTVSLLGEIWVQFVKVHGTPYVAFVANTPAPASGFAGTAVLVYRPWQHDCVVRIMHDPWGVRRIVFMCGNSKLSVSERKNIWWESLRLPTTSESQELTMFSDVRTPLFPLPCLILLTMFTNRRSSCAGCLWEKNRLLPSYGRWSLSWGAEKPYCLEVTDFAALFS